MSDQNFHEIQLSGKQLVFLFMCVAVFTVVVFLFGVSVGRGVQPGAAQIAQMPADSPDRPVALDEAAVPAQAAPNELSYAEALQGEGPAAVPPPPIAEAPAAEPNAGNAAAPPPAAGERAEAPPAPKAAGPPPVDGWVVQVGAFTANDVATREVAKLQAKGYPAFVFSEPPGVPGPRYKVRVGPYSARTDADRMLSDLTNEGYQPLLRR